MMKKTAYLTPILRGGIALMGAGLVHAADFPLPMASAQQREKLRMEQQQMHQTGSDARSNPGLNQGDAIQRRNQEGRVSGYGQGYESRTDSNTSKRRKRGVGGS